MEKKIVVTIVNIWHQTAAKRLQTNVVIISDCELMTRCFFFLSTCCVSWIRSILICCVNSLSLTVYSIAYFVFIFMHCMFSMCILGLSVSFFWKTFQNCSHRGGEVNCAYCILMYALELYRMATPLMDLTFVVKCYLLRMYCKPSKVCVCILWVTLELISLYCLERCAQLGEILFIWKLH